MHLIQGFGRKRGGRERHGSIAGPGAGRVAVSLEQEPVSSRMRYTEYVKVRGGAQCEEDNMAITNAAEEANATRLSYKFQRLREKLRNAVASGELSGKLPGERTLAKRFN